MSPTMETRTPPAEPYTIPSITPENSIPPCRRETTEATAKAIRSASPLEDSSTTGATKTAVKKSANPASTTALNTTAKTVLKNNETTTATVMPQRKTGIT